MLSRSEVEKAVEAALERALVPNPLTKMDYERTPESWGEPGPWRARLTLIQSYVRESYPWFSKNRPAKEHLATYKLRLAEIAQLLVVEIMKPETEVVRALSAEMVNAGLCSIDQFEPTVVIESLPKATLASWRTALIAAAADLKVDSAQVATIADGTFSATIDDAVAALFRLLIDNA